jgi:hypothetical protein
VTILGHPDDLHRVTEDEAAYRRLTRTDGHRGGQHDDPAGLVPGQTPYPGHGDSHPDPEGDQADHDRDPAQIHDVEVATL